MTGIQTILRTKILFYFIVIFFGTTLISGQVVTVSGDPAQAGIFIKRVPSGSIGDQTKVGFAAQIIDPGEWRSGFGNDVFTLFVIEKSISGHKAISWRDWVISLAS